MARVTVSSRVKEWSEGEARRIDRAVLTMATDVDRISATLAPKLTRALVKSRTIRRKGIAHYEIRYGNTQVPYARRRHFENKKNPQTIRYLERAGDAVNKNIARYIKGI